MVGPGNDRIKAADDPLSVVQPKLTDVVYDRLIEALMRGRIRPGERLMLKPLADRLNVSLTPLRQTLSRMQGEGLVEEVGRRGIYVSKLTPSDVCDLFDMRIMCETFAIESCIERISESEIRRLQELIEECDASLDSATASPEWSYARKDHELHSYLVSLAGNAKLAEWFDNLRVQLLVLMQQPRIGRRRFKQTCDEHRRILSALREHNVVTARDALRQHLANARDAALEALANSDEDESDGIAGAATGGA